MPSGRPPGSHPHVRVRDLLLLSLLVPVAAALQSQPDRNRNHHHHQHAALPDGDVVDSVPGVDEQWHAAVGQQLHHDVHVKHKAQKNTNVGPADVDNSHHGGNENNNNIKDIKDINNKSYNNNKKARISAIQQRALATVSPAEPNGPAVRAPPASRSPAHSSPGLASRHPARSLQDWQVEDLMLLATVDGKLYARDRGTGAARWELETSDMVQVIQHPHNKTYTPDGREVEEAHFVVEPSQDGVMYVLHPHFGLQKLPYTVKQLSEAAPYEETGDLGVTYTAEKKSTLYHIDAKTGLPRNVFLPGGSYVNKDQSCRLVSPLDDNLGENECETHGTIVLGRTEYTIGIHNRVTGEAIETIKYFEWSPNMRDNDLRNTYDRTMDDKYVYSHWNGRISGIDTSSAESYRKPDFTQVFAAPVVRVFDIIRPKEDFSQDASLAVLPQPIPPLMHSFAGLDDDEDFDPVYVNRTQSGSWYALSEKHYPSVTYHAPLATSKDARRWDQEDFAGVYNLPHESYSEVQLLDGNNVPLIDAAPPLQSKSSISEAMDTPLPRSEKGSIDLHWLTAFTLGITVTLLAVSGSLVLYKWPELRAAFIPQQAGVQMPLAEVAKVSTDKQPVRRVDEPAEELIFPQPAHVENEPAPPARVHFDIPDTAEEPLQRTVTGDAEPGDELKEGEPKPKKKATRGRRGGRKQKEKELAQAEARAAKKNDAVSETDTPGILTVPTSPDPNTHIISVAQSEDPALSITNPVAINNLSIYLDKEIGRGSAGTIVYQGNFEGRDVAVKRMLTSYCDLVELEVSFLQQSDGHTNVVRYFCRQRDDHFLYIAVELCQASLFDVWEFDRAKTEEQRQTRQKLKLAIQQNMKKSLQQVAAGLLHLHKLRIIHRDIKPQNILVAHPSPTQPPGTTRLVISDFGLGKNLPENMSTLIDPTGNVGTSGWKAPELINNPSDKGDSVHSRGHSENSSPSGSTPGVSSVKRAADIFALGCLFFWVLTDGVHPYEDESGWHGLRDKNIKQDKKDMQPLAKWSDAYEPLQLITSMLSARPEDRPTAQQVLNHPYFWTPEQRLQFLCDCSDHFEREVRGTWEDNYAGDSPDLCRLESRAREVIDAHSDRPDFLSKLDVFFVQTLGKQRKYTGSRLLDLLRALRNKKNHYEDMPEDVKKRVGPLDEGYLNYWCIRFPRLLMACHEVIQEAGLRKSARFKKYFDESL